MDWNFKRYKMPKIAINNSIVGKLYLEAIVIDGLGRDVVVFGTQYPDSKTSDFKIKHWYYSFRDQIWNYGAHPRFSRLKFNSDGLIHTDDETLDNADALKFLGETSGEPNREIDGEYHKLFGERLIAAILNEKLSNSQMTQSLMHHLGGGWKAERNYLGYWNFYYKSKGKWKAVTPAQLIIHYANDGRPTDKPSGKLVDESSD